MSNHFQTSRIIRFLTDIKAEALCDPEVRSIGNCGVLAAAGYIDDCVSLILDQQTRIADLEHRLKCVEEENKEYRRLAGDLEGLYPNVEDAQETV